MGQVTVRVGGFSHPVSCEDGQEPHLIALAAEVDRRLDSIRAMGGGGFPEARQILLAALLLADELHDLRTGKVALPAAPDPALAERLSRIAEKIETLTDGLARG
jgi:cell division protein ZapA